ELVAAVWALQRFSGPLNLVTDSLYVAGVTQRIEGALIKEVQNRRLYKLFLQLKQAVEGRHHPYCVIHIRSHKTNEGLGEGNAKADQLVTVSADSDKIEAARRWHEKYHVNAKGLDREFKLGISQARIIVRACPVCSFHNSGTGLGCGVNPRGLKKNEIWQMDVTHINNFGPLKYVHVTIDTYSKYVWATAQRGEKAIHVVRHLTSCFAVMGVPQQIKTDNGPAYVSQKVKQFLKFWKITHVTGIPHSPTGQAIIERAHRTLKLYLEK
ncbi:hypothetical protein N311_03184, partial [Apaloderma vittatum]